MSYTTLPPGRNRMMAYTTYLNSRRRNIPRLSPINRRTSTYQSLTVYSTPIVFSREISFNYNVLSSLEDVKVGLINKNLLTKSKISLNEDVNAFCVICQDNIQKEELIRTLKCKHVFNLECIDNWLTENKKCPTCKFEI